MTLRRGWAHLAVLWAVSPAGATLGPWIEHPEVRLRAIAAAQVAARADEVDLGLEFVTRPGWHVYWKNPGDAGFPMRVESASAVLDDLELSYPAPHRYRLPGDLQALGYEGAVVYPLHGRLRAAPTAERVALQLTLDFLVCEVECVPYRDEPRIELAVGTEPRLDDEAAALLAGWWQRVPGPPDPELQVQANLAGTLAEPVATFHFRGPPAVSRFADLFLEAHPAVDFGVPARQPTASGVRFDVTLRPKARRREGLGTLELSWTATGLPGDRAVASRTRLETARSVPGAAFPARVTLAALVCTSLLFAAALVFRRIRRRRNPR